MLSEQELDAALENFLTASREGTYDEWHEAMHLIVMHASPEQWDVAVECLRRSERPAAVRGAVRPAHAGVARDDAA
jgi:hypothetical protein